MSLTQSDADSLLKLPKAFESSVVQIDFPRVQAFSNVYALEDVGRREAFLFDLERGNRKRARLKFQTRARKVYILARIDIDGKPHTNPPGAPHRPGERFIGPHIHLRPTLALAPATKAGIDRRPGPKIFGQVSPGHTGPQNVINSAHDDTVLFWRSSTDGFGDTSSASEIRSIFLSAPRADLE